MRKCYKCKQEKELTEFYKCKGEALGLSYRCKDCSKELALLSRGKYLNGLYQGDFYKIWAGMKRRVLDENHKSYSDYGGRGIKVCDRWKTFEGFHQDMKHGYEKELTLERIDNNGDYCPENCKWADRVEQARNRRNSRNLEFNGKSQCLTAWAQELKVGRSTLAQRFYVLKWPIEKCLTYNN